MNTRKAPGKKKKKTGKTGNHSKSLRDTEERLQCVIDLSTDYYWEQDEEHRFTLIQHRDIDRPENDPRLFIGKTSWELGGTPINNDGSWDEHKAVREARQPFSDFLIWRSDPQAGERYLSISGQPVFDGRGRFQGYRGITRDVTKEKRAERLLRLERTVTRILVDAENPSEALQEAIRTICQSEGWDAGQYWSLDAENHVMRFYEGWCISDPVIKEFTTQARDLVFHPESGLVGVVWQTGEPLWIGDLNKETRTQRRDIAQRTGWGSAFLFPVTTEGKTIGVLDFNARYIPEPDERLLQVIQVLGSQIGNYYQRAIALEQLRESEELYSSTVELAAIGISHVAPDGRFTHVNSQLCAMLGYTREELLGLSVKDISHPDDTDVTDDKGFRLHAGEIDSFTVEKRYIHKDGSPIWVRLSIAARRWSDGTPQSNISIVEDITARKMAEERVQYLATHDEMTGLPNRPLFSQLLNNAIESGRRYKRKFAVLFIDLDRFKYINDSLGHECGDVLLKQMSVRFRECLRASDVVARLGGDEFVVLVQEINEPGQVAVVARNLLSATIKPVEIMGQEFRVTSSIGICMYPRDAEDEETLMKNADMAMYLAKEEGKNNFQFYSDDIKSHSIEKLTLESNLRRAMEQSEFTLHYQAKVNFISGDIKGAEALLRWNSPVLGEVSPVRFIPVAEEMGLIIPLGKWVIRTACEQNVNWQQQALSPICISVNLSPLQFSDPELVPYIRQVLESTGVLPELLELEITESMVMHNTDQAIKKLTEIKELGVKIAIDDFGTGYSSLSQLKRFPIDTLKVDRSFIRDIPDDGEDKALTEAIIAMGRTLGLIVIAEGVETAAQQTFLSDHSCDEMQGFYFSRPTAPEEFVELLRTHKPSRRS